MCIVLFNLTFLENKMIARFGLCLKFQLIGIHIFTLIEWNRSDIDNLLSQYSVVVDSIDNWI